MYVVRWRSYLTARSLGSVWLNEYASRVDPAPLRPSRGHQKANPDSAPIISDVPTSSLKVSTGPKLLVDAPLDSGSNEDSEGGDNTASAEGETGDYLDVEEMFTDD